MAARSEVTRLLADFGRGDRAALDRLMPLLYDELRGLARARLRRERPGHTLDTTSLVHEAYVRLVDADGVDYQGRHHFLSLAARVMRRVLVDHARRRDAAKRGGAVRPVTLDEDLGMGVAAAGPESLLAVHEALERLEAEHERPARLLELRYFGGLTNPEAAEVLGVSLATVERDLRFARAWLARLLDADAGGEGGSPGASPGEGG